MKRIPLIILLVLLASSARGQISTSSNPGTASSTATALLFGATNQPLTVTAPLSGQCLEYNGTGITGAACSSTGGYPAGSPPQIGGFAAANTSEAETVSGDCIFTRAGANSYTIGCTKSNGNLFTSTTFGAALNLSTLVSGDCTITAGGVLTCTKTNAVAFGALATLGVGSGLTSSGGNLTLAIPVTVGNGGTGTVSAPTSGQLLVGNAGGTAYAPQTASGSCTVNNLGVFACGGTGTVQTGVTGEFAVYTGNNNIVAAVGAVRNVCSFAGATADLQFAAAIAALPNGGIIDARCYGFTTQTLATEVTIPSNIPFTILVDRSTTFNCTITTGATKSCFHEQGQTVIEGSGRTGVAGGFGITLSNTASVNAEIFMDGTGGGLDNSVENIGLNGNSLATVANGILFAKGVGNVADISNVQTTANGSPLMMNLFNITGPMQLLNDYADCGSVAGTCTPLKISADNTGVGTNNVYVLGGVYAHEGAGGDCAEIDIVDAGVSNTGVIVDDVTLESAHTCAIGINATRAVASNFRAVGCSAAGANGNTCIKFSGLSNSDTVENENMYNAWTNTLTNSCANSVNVAQTITQTLTPNIVYYNYQGFNQPQEEIHTASNAGTMTFDNNGLIVNKVPIGSSTAAGISGGGALGTGSNSFAGHMTGLAATNNILTPGYTCPNAVTCAFQDNVTAGGIKMTAQGATTITFSATAADTGDYICGCR